MAYYVYKHINPLTQETFYVGKGSGNRAHDRAGRTPSWRAYVNYLMGKNATYSVVILKSFTSEFEAFEFERSTILEHVSQGLKLLNKQVALEGTEPEKVLIVDDPDQDWNRSSDLAIFIRNKRKACNLTQTEFASRAGVGLRFLRELESGKPTVRMDLVNQVLSLFGYSLKPTKTVEM